jgi:hypothetical protein
MTLGGKSAPILYIDLVTERHHTTSPMTTNELRNDAIGSSPACVAIGQSIYAFNCSRDGEAMCFIPAMRGPIVSNTPDRLVLLPPVQHMSRCIQARAIHIPSLDSILIVGGAGKFEDVCSQCSEGGGEEEGRPLEVSN